MNQIVLVGRLVSSLKTKEENGEKNAKLTLAIPRTFKNNEGLYETDFVDVIVTGAVAENTLNFCKKGDIIGVKGRVQSTTVEKYHTKINLLEIIGEKVTFLSNKTSE